MRVRDPLSAIILIVVGALMVLLAFGMLTSCSKVPPAHPRGPSLEPCGACFAVWGVRLCAAPAESEGRPVDAGPD